MAKGKENKMEKKDNLPNYTDYDEFSPDNFEFKTDNFDLNFEDEEATDEKELKRIQDMKVTKQKEQETNTKEKTNKAINNDDKFINNEDKLIKDKDESTSINDEKNKDDEENDEELKLQEHPFDNENLISEEEQQLAKSFEDDDLLKNERTSDIIKMDLEIDNMDLFIKHMESKDYQLESSRFLTKKFAEASDTDTVYSIVITVNNETITAITGYDMDDKVVTIPDAIKKAVKTDINDALQSFI